jgi:hypothetical protein
MAVGNCIMRNLICIVRKVLELRNQRGMRWSGLGMGEKRTVYQIMVGNPE